MWYKQDSEPKPSRWGSFRRALVRGVIGGVVGALVAPIVAPPIVGLFGFGSGGVVAGGSAAAWHAAIGIMPAGHLFAICQSVGAGGALPAIGYGIGAVVSFVVTSFVSYFFSK